MSSGEQRNSNGSYREVSTVENEKLDDEAAESMAETSRKQAEDDDDDFFSIHDQTSQYKSLITLFYSIPSQLNELGDDQVSYYKTPRPSQDSKITQNTVYINGSDDANLANHRTRVKGSIRRFYFGAAIRFITCILFYLGIVLDSLLCEKYYKTEQKAYFCLTLIFLILPMVARLLYLLNHMKDVKTVPQKLLAILFCLLQLEMLYEYLKLIKIKYDLKFFNHKKNTAAGDKASDLKSIQMRKQYDSLLALKKKKQIKIFLLYMNQLFHKSLPQHIIQSHALLSYAITWSNASVDAEQRDYTLQLLRVILSSFTISYGSMKYSTNILKLSFEVKITSLIKLLRYISNLILLFIQTIPLTLFLIFYQTIAFISMSTHLFLHMLYIYFKFTSRNHKFKRFYSSLCVSFIKLFTFTECLSKSKYFIFYNILLFVENITVILIVQSGSFKPKTRQIPPVVSTIAEESLTSNYTDVSRIRNSENNRSPFEERMTILLIVSISGFIVSIMIEFLIRYLINKLISRKNKLAIRV